MPIWRERVAYRKPPTTCDMRPATYRMFRSEGSQAARNAFQAPTRSTCMANSYIVQPVYKALQVLRCLGDERRELALSEICYRVDLPKTTVFRYLQTLCACGFVTHDPDTDLYRIGLRVWELGRSLHEPLWIRELALPEMRELRERFNETVNLGMLDGLEVVYLEI